MDKVNFLPLNFQSFVPDILAAIIAAFLLAGIAWAINWFLNLRLERKLKRTIFPQNLGLGVDDKTKQAFCWIQVSNYSKATIRIRSVTILCQSRNVLELKPSKDCPIDQSPLIEEITEPKFKRKYLSKGTIEPDGNLNAMVLPPKTMGTWEIPPKEIGFSWKVDTIYVAIEYPTIFGNTALIRMEAPEFMTETFRNNFEKLASCVRNKKPIKWL